MSDEHSEDDRNGTDGGRAPERPRERRTGDRPSPADLLPGDDPAPPAAPPRVPPAGPLGGVRSGTRPAEPEEDRGHRRRREDRRRDSGERGGR